MSTSAKVNERIARLRKGVPFSIEGFYQLGSHTSVQKAMSRMVKEGEIVRVSKGMYVRPKPLPSVPTIKVTASPEQVAKAWARLRGFKLASQGLEAAYKLGFQTQAPVKTVLWSNGPTREFKVGSATVSVRNVSPKKLRWLGRPEGMLLRSIAVTNPETIGIGEIKTALKRLSLSETEAKAVVRNLKSAPLPAGWKRKLEQIEHEPLL